MAQWSVCHDCHSQATVRRLQARRDTGRIVISHLLCQSCRIALAVSWAVEGLADVHVVQP